jgi:hypothetical protein
MRHDRCWRGHRLARGVIERHCPACRESQRRTARRSALAWRAAKRGPVAVCVECGRVLRSYPGAPGIFCPVHGAR